MNQVSVVEQLLKEFGIKAMPKDQCVIVDEGNYAEEFIRLRKLDMMMERIERIFRGGFFARIQRRFPFLIRVSSLPLLKDISFRRSNLDSLVGQGFVSFWYRKRGPYLLRDDLHHYWPSKQKEILEKRNADSYIIEREARIHINDELWLRKFFPMELYDPEYTLFEYELVIPVPLVRRLSVIEAMKAISSNKHSKDINDTLMEAKAILQDSP